MSLTDAIGTMAAELAPTFILICFMFIMFSWIRVLLDNMSGRGF